MADGKKICGIICEAPFAAGAPRIDFAVLGIGVNVNGAPHDMPVFDSPDRPRATSIFIETGRKANLPRLLGEILSSLDKPAGLIESENGRASLIEMYKKKSCTLDRQVRVITEEGETFGTASNITDGGALSVIDGENREFIFHSADVIHARGGF